MMYSARRRPAATFLLPLWTTTLLILLHLLPLPVSSQGCSSNCPPLTDQGVEVPSLCVDDEIPPSVSSSSYDVCHPNLDSTPSSFTLNDFRGSPGRVTVISNFYVGSNAGQRESGVYAHVAQRYYDEYGPDRVAFISSLKGGSTCGQWINIHQTDAESLFPGSQVRPKEMPLSVNDLNYELRDALFTPPYGHPSYAVLDGDLKVRAKFVGPCCGFESYYACDFDTVIGLDDKLSREIDAVLNEWSPKDGGGETAPAPTKVAVVDVAPTTPSPTVTAGPDCIIGEWSDWSPCSVTCGEAAGIQFRWRTINSGNGNGNGKICRAPVETAPCNAASATLSSSRASDSTVPCPDVCVPEFGSSSRIDMVQDGFDSPRDIAFHPNPGLHLGLYSEGREYHPFDGEEAWVVNGGNHSVSIVASVGVEGKQTTVSRTDRGYYHYMTNVTALSFNDVENSGRDKEKDSFNYWAVCNDNENDYLGTKEPNFFMGPTLYNSDPNNRNVVNRRGDDCGPGDQCFFLHSDMLHESPACIGIVHDPETSTAYGNVYWAFDATGDRENGQLVRFDFQQPHGPGSMDHSIAAVRRYPDVKLTRGPPGVHAGMVVHPVRREVYISNPGSGTVVVVGADTGTYARTAREEYPIFSNRLPSYEYSIYECADRRDFVTGLDTPTGLALSGDGERLFVAERGTGLIHAFDVASGSNIGMIETGLKSIGGMAMAPTSEVLHFVDDTTNSLFAVAKEDRCSSEVATQVPWGFQQAAFAASLSLGDDFSLHRDYTCEVDPTVPDASFFDQVHDDSGYADDDLNVQSSAGMDASAALLANRTDCEWDGELNFDAVLLGGYYCHVCLPNERGATCDPGGQCANLHWRGYTCDNEFVVRRPNTYFVSLELTDSTVVDPRSVVLRRGVTYRFTIESEHTVTALDAESKGRLPMEGNDCSCARYGPLLLRIDDYTPSVILLRSSQSDDDDSGASIRISVDGEPKIPPARDETSASDVTPADTSPAETSPADTSPADTSPADDPPNPGDVSSDPFSSCVGLFDLLCSRLLDVVVGFVHLILF